MAIIINTVVTCSLSIKKGKIDLQRGDSIYLSAGSSIGLNHCVPGYVYRVLRDSRNSVLERVLLWNSEALFIQMGMHKSSDKVE